MSTITEELPQTQSDEPVTDEGPKEAHYARKDKIAEAYVEGTEITALCGKKFVPSRDPENLPVCPRCKEIHDQLPMGGNPE
jgi:hypothetical protein